MKNYSFKIDMEPSFLGSFALAFIAILLVFEGWGFFLTKTFLEDTPSFWIHSTIFLFSLVTAFVFSRKGNELMFQCSDGVSWNNVKPGSFVRISAFVPNKQIRDNNLVIIHPVVTETSEYRLEEGIALVTTDKQLELLRTDVGADVGTILFLGGTTTLIGGGHVKYRGAIYGNEKPLSEVKLIDLDFFSPEFLEAKRGSHEELAVSS